MQTDKATTIALVYIPPAPFPYEIVKGKTIYAMPVWNEASTLKAKNKIMTKINAFFDVMDRAILRDRMLQVAPELDALCKAIDMARNNQ